MIGALPPAAIVYTRAAGRDENSTEKKLKMPALPELRKDLQKAGEER